jgi:hypothetical protein
MSANSNCEVFLALWGEIMNGMMFVLLAALGRLMLQWFGLEAATVKEFWNGLHILRGRRWR